MVPLAGIEPALLAELDFESSASNEGQQNSTIIYYNVRKTRPEQ